MKKETVNWDFEESYVGTENQLFLDFQIQPNHRITEVLEISYSDIGLFGILDTDLLPYGGEKIIVFFAIHDENSTSTTTLKRSNLKVGGTTKAQIVLIHYENNVPHKKVKKTQKNVSDIKSNPF